MNGPARRIPPRLSKSAPIREAPCRRLHSLRRLPVLLFAASTLRARAGAPRAGPRRADAGRAGAGSARQALGRPLRLRRRRPRHDRRRPDRDREQRRRGAQPLAHRRPVRLRAPPLSTATRPNVPIDATDGGATALSLAPGEKATLDLRVDTTKLAPGKFSKRCLIFTSDADHSPVSIPFTVEIDKPKAVVAEPKPACAGRAKARSAPNRRATTRSARRRRRPRRATDRRGRSRPTPTSTPSPRRTAARSSSTPSR